MLGSGVRSYGARLALGDFAELVSPLCRSFQRTFCAAFGSNTSLLASLVRRR